MDIVAEYIPSTIR